MKCPICGNNTKVIDVRHDCESIGRKRECKTCGHIFYSVEFIAEQDDVFEKEWSKYHRATSRYYEMKNRKENEK